MKGSILDSFAIPTYSADRNRGGIPLSVQRRTAESVMECGQGMRVDKVPLTKVLQSSAGRIQGGASYPKFRPWI